jgi:hypothetical protein
MPNPTLNQIIRDTILLENGNFSVSARMSRADRNSNLCAEWLQDIAIHIPIDQWSSVSALEDSTRCAIANVRLNDRHCVGVYVHFSMARFTLRGHFLVNESGPSDVNVRFYKSLGVGLPGATHPGLSRVCQLLPSSSYLVQLKGTCLLGAAGALAAGQFSSWNYSSRSGVPVVGRSPAAWSCFIRRSSFSAM